MQQEGMSKTAIFNSLHHMQTKDLNTKGGKVWAYVYDSGLEQVEEVAMEAYNLFRNHNGLDFTVFPSLLQLENDVVGMIAPLFSPEPDNIAGSFTSGGTESILLAVKAARDYARKYKPDIAEPEVILPITAHAAFFKACHYLNVKAVTLPVDDHFKVRSEDVEAHLTKNTIMLIASAVNYSHGVTDPIDQLGKIASKHDLWLHVDACIGGFVLSYSKKFGLQTTPFDFSVPGVTSLSVDLHKYAFAPKGASLVLYRDKSFRRYQFFACTNWTGYPVINTTVQSTKSGGPLAACWATLKFIGKNGYDKLMKQIFAAKNRLLKKLIAIEELYILGNPEASLIAFSSTSIDLFQLVDEMRKKRWYIQLQPGNKQFAPSIHLTITPVSEQLVDDFISDLMAAIEIVKNSPRKSVAHTILPLLSNQYHVLNEPLEGELLHSLLQIAGITKDGMLPEEMASINELLHLLPNEIGSEAFLYITNELFKASIQKNS